MAIVKFYVLYDNRFVVFDSRKLARAFSNKLRQNGSSVEVFKRVSYMMENVSKEVFYKIKE